MKLKDLLENVNDSLKDIEGCKYKSSIEFDSLIRMRLDKVETELGNLIRMGITQVRLITKKDINTFGSVGEVLFTAKFDCKIDRRSIRGNMGTFNKVEFFPTEEVKNLMDLELKELQSIFDERDYNHSIMWYDEEIERLKQKAKEMIMEKEELIQKRKEKELNDK